jgi:hypothetical protein
MCKLACVRVDGGDAWDMQKFRDALNNVWVAAFIFQHQVKNFIVY